MRTITTTETAFKFEELDNRVQQKAMEKLWDLNVDRDWWEWTYEDMSRIGLKCQGFDIDRGSYCSIKLESTWTQVAESILAEHGKQCDTYKIAEVFLKSYVLKSDLHEIFNDMFQAMPDSWSHDLDLGEEMAERHVGSKVYELESEIEDLEAEFKNDLQNAYLSMLRNEYEYLTSEEAIKETIEANNYEFNEDGDLI